MLPSLPVKKSTIFKIQNSSQKNSNQIKHPFETLMNPNFKTYSFLYKNFINNATQRCQTFDLNRKDDIKKENR